MLDCRRGQKWQDRFGWVCGHRQNLWRVSQPGTGMAKTLWENEADRLVCPWEKTHESLRKDSWKLAFYLDAITDWKNVHGPSCGKWKRFNLMRCLPTYWRKVQLVDLQVLLEQIDKSKNTYYCMKEVANYDINFWCFGVYETARPAWRSIISLFYGLSNGEDLHSGCFMLLCDNEFCSGTKNPGTSKSYTTCLHAHGTQRASRRPSIFWPVEFVFEYGRQRGPCAGAWSVLAGECSICKMQQFALSLSRPDYFSPWLVM